MVVRGLEFQTMQYFQHSPEISLVHAGYLVVQLFFVLSSFIVFCIYAVAVGKTNARGSIYLRRITEVVFRVAGYFGIERPLHQFLRKRFETSRLAVPIVPDENLDPALFDQFQTEHRCFHE